MPDKRAFSIEIGEDSFKIAQLAASKGARLITGLTAKSFTSQSPDTISEGIKSAFQSLGPAPENLRLNIPRHLITARFLMIPSVDDEEISKIMKLESIKHLPYSDDKVVYGYRIVEKTQDGYSKVLLAIAQAGSVNGYINILKKAGLVNLRSLSLSSESLFLWYIQAMEGREKFNTMVINLDRDHVDIDVVEKERLVFTRGILSDVKDPRSIESIVKEIKMSISSYQKESHNALEKIVLTGMKRLCENLKESIGKELKIPVDIIYQTENIPLEQNLKVEDEDFSFAEPFGLLMRPDDIKIDLIPDEAREEARFFLSKNNFITALVILSLSCALLFAVIVKKLYDKHLYLSALNAELKKIEKNVSGAKKMAKDIKAIQEMVDRKALAVDIVSEVYTMTPQGASLNIIDFESEKTLAIRGNAPSLNEVLKYVTSMEGSPYFESVKVKYANKRVIDNRETVDFEIDSVLSKIR